MCQQEEGFSLVDMLPAHLKLPESGVKELHHHGGPSGEGARECPPSRTVHRPAQ